MTEAKGKRPKTRTATESKWLKLPVFRLKVLTWAMILPQTLVSTYRFMFFGIFNDFYHVLYAFGACLGAVLRAVGFLFLGLFRLFLWIFVVVTYPVMPFLMALVGAWTVARNVVAEETKVKAKIKRMAKSVKGKPDGK